MREYEVVTITIYGDEEDDQDLRDNNMRHPELVRYVEDESAVFVIDTKTGRFTESNEFFYMHNIKKFQVTEWYKDDD